MCERFDANVHRMSASFKNSGRHIRWWMRVRWQGGMTGYSGQLKVKGLSHVQGNVVSIHIQVHREQI